MINTSFQISQNITIESSSRTKEIKQVQDEYKLSKQEEFTKILSQIQSILDAKSSDSSFEAEHDEFKTFLLDIGYKGKSIASLSKSEAAELVGEDGFFGVAQTSERIAQFVIDGAGGNEDLLREGKKGIIEGFKEAESMWGEKLPDISYETLDKAVAMIDKALIQGGFSVLNEKA